MKCRISALLDEDILRQAKRRATDDGRSLSDLIEDALECYLSQGSPEPARRDAAYHLFCEQSLHLVSEQLKVVLKRDS